VEYSIGGRPLPADYREENRVGVRAPDVSARARLNGYRYRDLDWHTGVSLWTQDFPRADRHFSLAVRRLTRIHVRSVEQPVNLDEGDAYDWPWLYAVQVGEWGLTGVQGQELREYLLRAGFFMADDFHGNADGPSSNRASARRCPSSPSARLTTAIPIFHRLRSRPADPGAGEAHLRAGYKSNNGPSSRGAHWRGIYDDKGRIIVAISYNSDYRRRLGVGRRPSLSRQIRRPRHPFSASTTSSTR